VQQKEKNATKRDVALGAGRCGDVPPGSFAALVPGGLRARGLDWFARPTLGRLIVLCLWGGRTRRCLAFGGLTFLCLPALRFSTSALGDEDEVGPIQRSFELFRDNIEDRDLGIVEGLCRSHGLRADGGGHYFGSGR